jgi:hypothetical protein
MSTALKSSHANPFAGKCIHGESGAYLVAGKLVNPECAKCKEAK